MGKGSERVRCANTMLALPKTIGNYENSMEITAPIKVTLL